MSGSIRSVAAKVANAASTASILTQTQSLLRRAATPLLSRNFASGVQGPEETGNGNDHHLTGTGSGPIGPVCSYNEWDPLEEVIVGRLEGAVVPGLTVDFEGCFPNAHRDFFINNAGKPFPADTVKKAHEEVEGFVRVLEQEGIIVKRPDVFDFSKEYVTPDFRSKGLYAAMPRDILLVIGDEIIEAPMSLRSRFFEYKAYRTLIKDYFKRGAKWTTGPRPTMSDELYNPNFDPEMKQDHTKEKVWSTTEFEPCFDAADFIRAGRDIFCQRSLATNMFGIDWMRRHLGDRYNLHVLTVEEDNPKHIDATIAFMGPGLMAINPTRPCHQIEMFRKAGWKTVEVPQPVISEDRLWLTSSWISMNTIMLDPGRVVVNELEIPTIKLFESLGIKCIKLPFVHANALGGSFHCWTCDVRRRGTLESYF